MSEAPKPLVETDILMEDGTIVDRVYRPESGSVAIEKVYGKFDEVIALRYFREDNTLEAEETLRKDETVEARTSHDSAGLKTATEFYSQDNKVTHRHIYDENEVLKIIEKVRNTDQTVWSQEFLDGEKNTEKTDFLREDQTLDRRHVFDDGGNLDLIQHFSDDGEELVSQQIRQSDGSYRRQVFDTNELADKDKEGLEKPSKPLAKWRDNVRSFSQEGSRGR